MAAGLVLVAFLLANRAAKPVASTVSQAPASVSPVSQGPRPAPVAVSPAGIAPRESASVPQSASIKAVDKPASAGHADLSKRGRASAAFRQAASDEIGRQSLSARPAASRKVIRQSTPVRLAASNSSANSSVLASPSEQAEVVTDFFPLIDSAAPFERGQMLRVQLPAAAMQAVGLPVREEHLSDLVHADVLVGEEGMPRAIRFVKFDVH